jgi:hypothetical protein
MTAVERWFTRKPPRWLRIVSAVVALIGLSGLSPEDSLRSNAETIFLAGVVGINAIAPRWLYESREPDWFKAHPVLSALAISAFLSVLLYFLLSEFVSDGLSVAIALPTAAVSTVVGLALHRAREAGRP